ncbi:MAG: hypothetical protein IJU11_03380 [Prevotella sp.]|nr:hypothetical protein [Prevotella sp.]
MKKQYMMPEMEIVKLEQEGMLCISSEIEGGASEPGFARMIDFGEEEDFEDE